MFPFHSSPHAVCCLALAVHPRSLSVRSRSRLHSDLGRIKHLAGEERSVPGRARLDVEMVMCALARASSPRPGQPNADGGSRIVGDGAVASLVVDTLCGIRCHVSSSLASFPFVTVVLIRICIAGPTCQGDYHPRRQLPLWTQGPCSRRRSGCQRTLTTTCRDSRRVERAVHSVRKSLHAFRLPRTSLSTTSHHDITTISGIASSFRDHFSHT